KGEGPAGLTLASETLASETRASEKRASAAQGSAAQGSAAAEARRWPLSQALAESRPLTMDDLAGQIGELPAGNWTEPPGEAMILPLYAGAEAIGVLVLAASAGHSRAGGDKSCMN